MDLNADIGEEAGNDRDLLAIVTSASIACGAHAGSRKVMHQTVRLARDAAVTIGAHPGYPDREHFGRRELTASPSDIERWTSEQIEELMQVCRSEGTNLRYVKAHGALYNRAVHDSDAAAALVAAIAAVDRELVLLAPPASAMLRQAEAAGLAAAREAFLDREYLSDGSLVPRDRPRAVIQDPEAAAARALALVARQPISDVNGGALHIEADSLCVHGDSPAAVPLARSVRDRLQEAGVMLAPFAEP